jgi:hypothetical protein
MDDARVPGAIKPMQVRHRRVEGKEAVERQGRGLAVEPKHFVAAQRHIVWVADRCDRGEAVERAAQHDHEESRVAAFRPRGLR